MLFLVYRKCIEMEQPKFIITRDGMFRMGYVYLHRDLLKPGDVCYGGGFFEFDYVSNRLLLSGFSTDFGKPKWERLTVLKVPEAYRGLRIIYAQWGDWEKAVDIVQQLTVEYV